MTWMCILFGCEATEKYIDEKGQTCYRCKDCGGTKYNGCGWGGVGD